jgi:cytochrome c oxidase assembly protein subunit 11
VDRSNRRTVLKLALVVAAMFGFGFALVPLYGAICQLTGLNGKNPGMYISAARASQAVRDDSRTVTVQFLTAVNGGGPWSFRAEQPQIAVHPGELYTVYFVAKNERDEEVVGQAVPSVAPWNAAVHLHKTECFCFSQQRFAPHEKKVMPVRFMLDASLPRDVDTVTLSYTFFDVTTQALRNAPSV